ncbi:MAG: hypothetical protein FWC89_13050 [Defluviitaleaceae bacterium]|nr:hypothetical protein [Defluviitaleaceae bacterium]
MGMTNEQFDAYKNGQLRLMERVQKEIAEQNAKSETLNTMIEDLKSELKKP